MYVEYCIVLYDTIKWHLCGVVGVVGQSRVFSAYSGEFSP